MNIDELMNKFNDDISLKLIPAIYSYFDALKRIDNEDVNEKFVNFVVEKDWIGIDELMWQYLTDDERDFVSCEILKDAQNTVNNLYLADIIFKQVVIRIVQFALKL